MTSQKKNKPNTVPNMLRVEGKNFNKLNISVDYKNFVKCKFTDCVLVYHGSEAVNIQNCTFNNVKWSFAGYAANTIEFMRAMYKDTGTGGHFAIEEVFESIKKNKPLDKLGDNTPLSDISEEILESLPESIGDYKKRVAVIDNAAIIEYSKRALMMRHFTKANFPDETVNENLLFEVVSPNLETAVMEMQNKIERNKEKINKIIEGIAT